MIDAPEKIEPAERVPVVPPASQVIHPKLAAPLFKLIKANWKIKPIRKVPMVTKRRRRSKITRP